MRISTLFITCCLLLVPVYGFSAQHDGPVVPQTQKPVGVGTSPIKAKPAQKPKSTSSKDKVSAAGYGEDPGEETQERPNPLNKQGQNRPAPVKAPVR